MRVLHVSTWDAPCGIATYSGNLVRSLDRVGIHSDVYPLAPHRWKTFTAGDVAELQADIAKQALRYDVVHFQHEHGLFGHAVSYKAAARNFGAILRLVGDAGRPVVTTFHTEPLGSRPAGRRPSLHGAVRTWARRIVWRKHVSRGFASRPDATVAIAHSPATRRSLIRQGLPAAAVHIVPHGCLPQRELRLDALSAKERLGLPAGTVLLTMFGFLGAYKGHDVAVRALARMPERFHLAICGGAHPESQNNDLATLIRLVRKLGLEQRVTITGWLAEEAAELHYAATDICLAPYVDASLSASGAITWALASGKPTIASRIPAFQDICREHPCLLLTSPGMVDEIVWAADKLAGDPDISRQLVAAASRYTEGHSWDVTAAATRYLYESLLAGDLPTASGIGRSRIVDRPEPSRASSADFTRIENIRQRRRTAG
jgi:glycosyltransferase involved in cell wall biosynthesis